MVRRFREGLLLIPLMLGCQSTKSPPPERAPTRALEAVFSPGVSAPPASSPAPGLDRIQDTEESPDAPSPALVDLRPFSGSLSWGDGAHAQGRNGVVTSVEAAATRVGVAILEQGGNALDAAVATALALSVTHPSAANLGGGGFLLVRHRHRLDAIDFREDSPSRLDVDEFWKMIEQGGHGPHSVGVPGTVAGLFLAHQRHGKLPWRVLVAPAEELAQRGYVLGARQALTLHWARRHLRASLPATQAFFDGGAVKKQGMRVFRPRLALALARIRERGALGFYEGETARDLVQSTAGALSLADLANYRAKVRQPLYFDFAGYRIVTMPPPSGGGITLTAQLRMLEAMAISTTQKGSAERYHLIAETSRRAQLERLLFTADPETLPRNERAAMHNRALDPDTWLREHPIEPARATQSESLDPAYRELLREGEQTTHLSVIDAEGMLVSCTLTLSASFGSHIFTDETGIVLNNSVASFGLLGKNTPAPGKRTVSSMAPTLAFLGDNALVLGSPGGDTIPSTIAQLLLFLALDGHSLSSALLQPRVHQGFIPQPLGMERHAPLPQAVRAQLKAWGHEPTFHRSSQGDANIAAWVSGTAYAVVDPREGGLARAAALPAANTNIAPPATSADAASE